MKNSNVSSARVLLALTLLTALAGCGKTSDATQPGAKPTAGKAALSVRTTSASWQSLPGTLSANGTVAAWQEAIIGPEVSGLRVAELLVNVGDHVRKGQPLASFARESVLNDLHQAEAALGEARAASALAHADGDRARHLRGSGSLSEQQVQQLLSQEQTAQARLDSAQAQVAAQQLRLSQTILRSPDDGVISARSAAIGTVPAQGSEMFRLIRQNRLEWRGEFGAAELELIRPGQSVRITSPSGSIWLGRVRVAAPTVDSSTRRGAAYVDITKPETHNAAAMRPGAYVRGEVALGARQALVLPPQAVVARDGYHLVFVVGPDSRVSQRKVQIGQQVGDRLEILSGVQPSDRLVASGGAFLGDGDAVQVLTEAAAPAQAAQPAQR